MNTINCPECGNKIIDNVQSCPQCGFVLKRQKKGNKKLFVTICGIIVLCTLIVLSILLIMASNSIERKTIKIIESDLGYAIDVIDIYYNEDEQGCIVGFYRDGIEDIACVYLEDGKIGYKSTFEEYNRKMDDAITNSDRRKYAEQLLDYPYDVIWVYRLLNSTDESSWKKIK